MAVKQSEGQVVAHNWDLYDYGSGPPVRDRLCQGPFPEYPPEWVFPGGDVVMTTALADEAVPNFGRGLVRYIAVDMGTAEIVGDDKAKAIEEMVRVPLGQKLYIRPTWREVQPRRGRLDFPEYWRQTFDLAKQYNKRVGLRIQMRAPDYREESLPDYVWKSADGEAGRAMEAEHEGGIRRAGLRSSVLPGVLRGTQRAAGGWAERQPAGGVRRHVPLRGSGARSTPGRSGTTPSRTSRRRSGPGSGCSTCNWRTGPTPSARCLMHHAQRRQSPKTMRKDSIDCGIH